VTDYRIDDMVNDRSYCVSVDPGSRELRRTEEASHRNGHGARDPRPCRELTFSVSRELTFSVSRELTFSVSRELTFSVSRELTVLPPALVLRRGRVLDTLRQQPIQCDGFRVVDISHTIAPARSEMISSILRCSGMLALCASVATRFA